MIKIRGIPFRIHPLFWFILALCLVTGYIWNVCIVFSIVLIHEIGHILAAKWFSWEIDEVMIFPFGGVLKVHNNGAEPVREALIVTLAGPVQHLLIPGISYLLLSTPFWNQSLHQLVLMYNLSILLFNLLPIWPLDGAKLISFLLMVWLPFKKAMTSALVLSLFILIGLAFILNYQRVHLESLFLSVFFLLMLWNEWQMREVVFVRFLLSRWHHKSWKPSRHTMVVSLQDTLSAVTKRFYKTKTCDVQIKETGKRLSESQILDYYFSEGMIHQPLESIINYF